MNITIAYIEHHFLAMFKSSQIFLKIMSMYEISSYIASINYKTIANNYFSKTLNIHIPILVKKVLSQPLKPFLFDIKFIHQIAFISTLKQN